MDRASYYILANGVCFAWRDVCYKDIIDMAFLLSNFFPEQWNCTKIVKPRVEINVITIWKLHFEVNHLKAWYSEVTYIHQLSSWIMETRYFYCIDKREYSKYPYFSSKSGKNEFFRGTVYIYLALEYPKSLRWVLSDR